jgi:hypothetical protein
MLFDAYLLLQKARLHDRPGTKQNNYIRWSIHRLCESLLDKPLPTAAKPQTNEVSRELALSCLLTRDDHGPFGPF